MGQTRVSQRDSLLPFIAFSLALHIVFLIIFSILPSTLPVPKFLKKKAEEEEKKPIYVKILDMPKPKKEETPPKNAHIISQFNTRKKGPKGKQLPSFASGSAPVLTPKPGPPIDIPGTPGHPGSKPSVASPLTPLAMEQPPQEAKKESKEERKGKAAETRESVKQGTPPKPVKKAAKENKEKMKKEAPSQKVASNKREERKEKKKIEAKKEPQKSQVVVKKEPSPNVKSSPSTPPVPKRKIPLFDPALINQYAKRLNPQMDTGESVTLELDTKKSKYISYFQHIKEKLYLVWRYPSQARAAGIQGALRLLFVIDRSGHLTEVRLLTSSGYTILDNEALRAIRAAAPFGPFPSDWREKELRIKARFIYRLYSEGFQ